MLSSYTVFRPLYSLQSVKYCSSNTAVSARPHLSLEPFSAPVWATKRRGERALAKGVVGPVPTATILL